MEECRGSCGDPDEYECADGGCVKDPSQCRAPYVASKIIPLASVLGADAPFEQQNYDTNGNLLFTLKFDSAFSQGGFLTMTPIADSSIRKATDKKNKGHDNNNNDNHNDGGKKGGKKKNNQHQVISSGVSVEMRELNSASVATKKRLQPQQPLELCFRVEKQKKGDQRKRCLSYINPDNGEWECLDEKDFKVTEISRETELLCGKTPHLTSFAVLLGAPPGGGPGGSGSSGRNIQGIWIAEVVLAGTIILLAILIIVLGPRVRFMRKVIFGYDSDRGINSIIKYLDKKQEASVQRKVTVSVDSSPSPRPMSNV